MNRRFFGRATFGLVATLPAAAASAAAPGSHRVAMQVDTDDHRTQLLALGNARNYAAHYRGRGEAFEIRIVAFGPGYAMVHADASGVKDPLDALRAELGGSLTILACRNTRLAIAKSENKAPDDIPLLPGVAETPSGIVALAELQEAGWPYIRP